MIICCNCYKGYTPYVLNGECRFCYGKKPNINTINNNIFYDNKYFKIFNKINELILNKNLNDKYT